MEANERKLEAIQYGCGQTISTRFQRRVNVESYMDQLTKQLTIAAHIKVWEEHLPEDYVAIFLLDVLEPKTWFQRFKQECFPKWLKKLFPIKKRKREEKFTKVVRIAKWVRYPDFDPVCGKGTRIIKITQGDWNENP